MRNEEQDALIKEDSDVLDQFMLMDSTVDLQNLTNLNNQLISYKQHLKPRSPLYNKALEISRQIDNVLSQINDLPFEFVLPVFQGLYYSVNEAVLHINEMLRWLPVAGHLMVGARTTLKPDDPKTLVMKENKQAHDIKQHLFLISKQLNSSIQYYHKIQTDMGQGRALIDTEEEAPNPLLLGPGR